MTAEHRSSLGEMERSGSTSVYFRFKWEIIDMSSTIRLVHTVPAASNPPHQEDTAIAGPLRSTRPMRTAENAARWKRIAFALCLATITIPSPSHALPGGSPRLPPRTPDPSQTPGPLETPQPTAPPTVPLLSIGHVGVDFIEIRVRPPAFGVSRLSKQPPGGTFAPFGSLTGYLTPGSNIEIRDEDVGIGKQYCYRLTIGPEETHTACTTTDWRLGFEGLGISEAESAKMLRLFDWIDTEELDEDPRAATPHLYHMNVLVEGNDPGIEYSLRRLGMHVQDEPIFPEELASWDDSQAIAQACDPGPITEGIAAAGAPGIGTHLPPGGGGCVPIGRWLFAVVPGPVYNALRVKALEQIGRGEEPAIRALVFRRVPVDAALGSGFRRHELNYVYLGEQGLEFNAIPEERCYIDENGDRVCEISQPLLGWLLNMVVGWLAEGIDLVIEAVQGALGKITRLVKGEVILRLNFRLLNTDPLFGTDKVMRSGWSGRPLYLDRVKIEVRQGLAAFIEQTNEAGFVALRVAKNSNTKVCIKVENHVAELTKSLIETTVCVADLGRLTAPETNQTIDVRKGYINTLAAMTDAHDYLKTIAEIDVPKITVLVGGSADTLSVEDRAFAPCMGRRPNLTVLLADLTALLGLVHPGFLAIATGASVSEFFYSVDVVLPTAFDNSRGVPVHEYGHAVMCELLLDRGEDAFQMAWTDVILASANQVASNDTSYVTEAFADFLSEQIVGGTNYFSTTDAKSSLNMHYCLAGYPCFDRNFSARSEFGHQVARVTSILHDAFDGHGQHQGFSPNDGSHWAQAVPNGPLTHVGADDDSDSQDEAVKLRGFHLKTLFEHWDERGQTMTEENFLGGLSDLMKAEGISESDRCALFALHDSSATCPSYVLRRGWMDWITDLPNGTLTVFATVAPPEPVLGAAPSRASAFVGAIADLDPTPDPAPEPGDSTCAACSVPVIFEGRQTVRVAKLGSAGQEAAFAFRLGDGSFKAIDPLGQLLKGTWLALDSAGFRLRLLPAPESGDAFVSLLEEAAKSLGVDEPLVRMVGAPKLDLRLGGSGAMQAQIALRFEIDVDGRPLRGTYQAKLRATHVRHDSPEAE